MVAMWLNLRMIIIQQEHIYYPFTSHHEYALWHPGNICTGLLLTGKIKIVGLATKTRIEHLYVNDRTMKTMVSNL